MVSAPQCSNFGRGIVTGFSLIAGLSTLTCCALPALFLTFGLGASLASLVSSMPWLITLSANKELVFLVAVSSLLLAGWLQWRARNQACAANGLQAIYCSAFRRFSLSMLGVSAVAIAIGAFYAFFATSFV